jgi:hypothetical protein
MNDIADLIQQTQAFGWKTGLWRFLAHKVSGMGAAGYFQRTAGK